MSADNQNKPIDYYDYSELEAQAKASEEAKKRVVATYGPTARMIGESIEQYEAMTRKLEEEAARKPRKVYMHDAEVEKIAMSRLEAERTRAYNAVVAEMPKQIADQFEKGEDRPKTLEKYRHLGSAVLGKITLQNGDGSMSLVNVYIANFKPGSIDPADHVFNEIPEQRGKTSRDNTSITYVIGRRINPDGSLGPVDTRFAAKNGSAQMTNKLIEVRKAVMSIGMNNIAIKQREAAAKAKTAPVTAQIGSQSERDRIRAHQAQLRAQEDGRNYGREEHQAAGRSFGR